MDFDLPTAFIFMKVGNHAGETFESILERKRREFDRAGKIFLGLRWDHASSDQARPTFCEILDSE